MPPTTPSAKAKDPKESALYVWAVRGLAGYAIIGGSVTLIGWVAHIPRLTDWNDNGIAMFANTALAAVCSGVAVLVLAARKKWSGAIGCALGIVVFLIGSATLIEHITAINLGIDTLLVQPSWGFRAAVVPGR